MSVIEISGITKDYGNSKGVFDLSFSVKKGEVFGFLGPNGAGKTTAIRQLMGFIHPEKGFCTVNGKSCKEQAAEIQREIGYLPGEIAFIDDMTGMDFIRFMADMKGLKSLDRAKQLMDYFELDAKGRIAKMSKGMKQKVGIICAFMHDPDIYLLDEPTSGLDPLMQNLFIRLILDEKAKGKTVLMSSHMFEEVERTCDRVAIIKQGRLVAVDSIAALQSLKRKSYLITFDSESESQRFLKEGFPLDFAEENWVTVSVKEISPLIKKLSKYNVTDFSATVQTLEQLFLHYYGGNNHD